MIRVLHGTESVRKRPGMYFGNFEDGSGINLVIYEAVANAIDQYLAGLATRVSVSIDAGVITVEDDGPGLPFDKESHHPDFDNLAECYFLSLHNSPTADHHAPHVHVSDQAGASLAGVGMAAANAVCATMDVSSSNGETVFKQSFRKGIKSSPLSKTATDQPSGTKLTFMLDREIVGDNHPNLDKLRTTLLELAHFYPGLIVEYQTETFVSNNGLLGLTYLYDKTDPKALSDKQHKKFHFSGRNGDVQIQVAAIGEADEITEYRSWVNGCETAQGGTHVSGLQKALSEAGWQPKLALIQVIMFDPEFAGPTKSRLVNDHAEMAVTELLRGPLQQNGQS